jgi:hypothetical protein
MLLIGKGMPFVPLKGNLTGPNVTVDEQRGIIAIHPSDPALDGLDARLA